MGTAMLIIFYAGAVLAIVFFAVIVVLAERSLKRQQGSHLQRSAEESLHLSHAASYIARSGNGGGGGG